MDTVNIKDLILDETERKTLSSKKVEKKKEPPVRFKTIVQSGCDFAIERICRQKKSRLVVLVSQNQFYIEEEGKKRFALNRKRMSEFLKGLNGKTIELPKVGWISRIRGSKEFVGEFMEAVSDEEVMRLARKGNILLPDAADEAKACDLSTFGRRKCRKDHRLDAGRDEWHPMPFGYRNPLDDPFGNMRREFTMNPMENIFTSWQGRVFGAEILERRPCAYDPWNILNAECFDKAGYRMYMMAERLADGSWGQEAVLWICVFMHKASPALYDFMIKELAAAGSLSKKELFEKRLFHFESREFLCFQSFFSFVLIGARFGIEYAKEAMRMYLAGGITDIIPFQELSILLYGQNELLYANASGYGGLDEVCEFEPKRFIKYLLKESQEQGYGERMERFLLEWSDTLTIQKYLFDNIEEKYPQHLASSEVKYVSLAVRCRLTIYENMWKKAAEKMKRFEYKGSKYQIVCPKSTADLMTEANHQRNCVADYEKDILSGNTMIFFMRSCNPEAADRSILTIELSTEGMVNQVKARFNEPPGIRQLEFVKEWAKEKGLCIASDIYPVHFGNDFLEELYE